MSEQATLGAVLLDNRVLDEVLDEVAAEDFADERHRWVLEGMSALGSRGEPIDILTLRDELGRAGSLTRVGIDYLAELTTACPAATSAVHYARRVAEQATRRRLGQAGRDIAALAEDADGEVEQLVAQAEAAVLGVSPERQGRQEEHILAGVRAAWSEMERDIGRRVFVTGIPTGFTPLDRFTGGWQAQELTVLGARPSVGKTSLGLGFARRAAAAGFAVWVYSLEMSRKAVHQRVLIDEAGVDGWRLRTGRSDAVAYQRIARAISTIEGWRLWIDDTPSLSVATLRHRVRRRVAEKRCDLVIVDYLGLMSPRVSDQRASQEVKVGNIALDLKALAKSTGVPMIACCQLSRASENRADRRPQLSDLRDSGNIEAHADLCMLLYREGMNNPEVDASLTKLIVAKNRNGPVGDVDLIFLGEQCGFVEPYRSSAAPIG